MPAILDALAVIPWFLLRLIEDAECVELHARQSSVVRHRSTRERKIGEFAIAVPGQAMAIVRMFYLSKRTYVLLLVNQCRTLR